LIYSVLPACKIYAFFVGYSIYTNINRVLLTAEHSFSFILDSSMYYIKIDYRRTVFRVHIKT